MLCSSVCWFSCWTLISSSPGRSRSCSCTGKLHHVLVQSAAKNQPHESARFRYHHVTVLLFTWDTHVRDGSSSRYFVFINFVVHSVMYTYYAIMAIGVRSVSSISIMITSMQIIQMAIGKPLLLLVCNLCVLTAVSTGMFVLLRVSSLLGSENKCSDSAFTVLTGLLMYASYFILFANFFVKRYVLSPASKKQESVIRKRL